LAYEFYIGASAKYSKADADITDDQSTLKARGVKVSNSSYHQDMDPTTIYMPNADISNYFKQVLYGDVSLAKVFNYSSYWFTFPISLQRESVFLKYRYYNLERFNELSKEVDINEATIGATLSTVFLNSFELPLSLEYIYNDDKSGIVKDKSMFKFVMGLSF
jgi:hypothetical protein